MSRKLLYAKCGIMEGCYNFKLEGGNCLANAGVGEDWFTVYLIETNPAHRNKGEAQELLKAIKAKCEEKGKKLRLFCPMNPIIEHICEKLDIEIIKD